jgi:predicted negative regulator of RcsB-dependent stress response
MSLFKKNEKRKEIHEHLHRLATMNTVLAVIALVAILGLFAWVATTEKNDDQAQNEVSQQVEVADPATPQPVSETAPEQEDIAAQYRLDINALLSDFDFEDSAEAEQLSYEALELFAPRELRSMHLQVVVALQEVQQGKTQAAQKRIDQIQAQYDWFLSQ